MSATTIQFTETFRVPVATAQVWSLLTDPHAVVSCVPGAAITSVEDDESLKGTLTVALGPTRVTFDGTVVTEFDDDRREGRLQARGADTQRRTKAAAVTTFRATELPASGTDIPGTEVLVDAAIEASGALAPFARTGGLHLARQLLHDFSVSLVALAASQGAAVASPADAPDPPADTAALSGFRLLARTLRAALRDLLRRLGRRPPTSTGDRTIS